MIARLLRTPTCALAACLLPASALLSQPGYTPTPENVAARTWFQDARFGLFVHWGVYSQMGAGEWVMNNRSIRASDYERLPSSFNPTAYDATAWVALAKAAGMKYITITSKHHDGFAMFNSKVSDYTIVKRTPFARDPIRQLVDAAGKEGIKVFFYYSQLDWHHPDYFPLGSTGRQTGRPDGGNFDRYLDYMNGQLKELLTNYGPVGGIWFDGMWDKPEANWRLDEQYRLIHQLQPAALIGSNHHVTPIAGEDFQMIEKDLPGRTAPDLNKAEMSTLPLETCETIERLVGVRHHRSQLQEPRVTSFATLCARRERTPTSSSTSDPCLTARSSPSLSNGCGPSGSGWRSTASPCTGRVAGPSRRGRGG